MEDRECETLDTEESVRKVLEHQYSPSQWSRRLNAQEVMEAHVKFCLTASEKARDTIPFEVLRYGNRPNQLLDMYGTSLPQNSPVLVFIHGGYWQDLDRSISAYLVAPLFKHGIRVAVVGYDLAPAVTLNIIIEEMVELYKFLTSWSIKTGAKDIWFAGHSAGAYLTAAILRYIAENESLKNNLPIRGAIFISGIYDLRPLVDTYVNDQLKLSRLDAEKLSLHRINLKISPEMNIIIAVAENDSDEFGRQSLQFYERLSCGDGTVNYYEIKGKDHFDIVEKLNDEYDELTQAIIGLICNTESR